VTRKLKVLAAAAGTSAAMAAAFFLHPRLGARRRAVAGAAVKRESANVAAMVGSALDTPPRRLLGRGNDPQLASVARLALQVAFGDKADGVTVRAERGLVTLRGEVDQIDDIDAYEAAVRSVPGVDDVDNLLRLQLTGQVRPNVLSA
jgi:osmotically-inducible protein OsmY